jgi:hypothetical protein
VRALFSAGRFPGGAGEDDRAHLWTRVVCGRTLAAVLGGSLADSYREWEAGEGAAAAARAPKGGEDGAALEALVRDCRDAAAGAEAEEERRRLRALLAFHGRAAAAQGTPDSLLPPVALAVLRAGVPPAAAGVVLSRMAPAAMPLLGLAPAERAAAARVLHADFYLLARYHLPLLALHLDAHRPGWHWPQARTAGGRILVAKEGDGSEGAKEGDNGEGSGTEGAKEGDEGKEAKTGNTSEEAKQGDKGERAMPHGLIPLHWLATLFAGECGGAGPDRRLLLPLWDRVLTEGERPWKYFLALALLEQRSEALLMVRGAEVTRELERAAAFEGAARAGEARVGAGAAPAGAGGGGVAGGGARAHGRHAGVGPRAGRPGRGQCPRGAAGPRGPAAAGGGGGRAGEGAGGAGQRGGPGPEQGPPVRVLPGVQPGEDRHHRPDPEAVRRAHGGAEREAEKQGTWRSSSLLCLGTRTEGTAPATEPFCGCSDGGWIGGG